MRQEHYIHGEFVLVDELDALRKERVVGDILDGVAEFLLRVRVDHVRHGLERLETLDHHFELKVNVRELSERGLVQVLVDAVVDVVDSLESGWIVGRVEFARERSR